MTKSLRHESLITPNVIGMALQEARALLDACGCEVITRLTAPPNTRLGRAYSPASGEQRVLAQRQEGGKVLLIVGVVSKKQHERQGSSQQQL